MKQLAIETCITGMLLDMTRLFKRFASIENVGDKRYWEKRLKIADKQYTIDTSKHMTVLLSGNISLDASQNTAPTRINVMYIDKDIAPVSIQILSKRKTLNLPFSIKIIADNYIDALSLTEEIIDKASTRRTFPYVVLGNQHLAQYKIQYDVAQQNKAEFSYENTENGVELEFTAMLEMHYYSIVHNTIPNVKTLYATQITTVDLGDKDSEGNPILVEVEEQIPILVSEYADILNADTDVIRRAIGNIIIKSA